MENKKWSIIYPAYLNCNRSVNQGRIVAKEKCVPDPRCHEIKSVLETIKGIQVVEEANKVYPRELDKESLQYRGRVKYKLAENDTKFKTKKDVIMYLCEMIPKLKTRVKIPNVAANHEQSMNSKKKKKNKGNKG